MAGSTSKTKDFAHLSFSALPYFLRVSVHILELVSLASAFSKVRGSETLGDGCPFLATMITGVPVPNKQAYQTVMRNITYNNTYVGPLATAPTL